MRDIQLNALRETFSRIASTPMVESHAPLRENKIYLPEAKKRFPHLTESYLLENKLLMENINYFKVTVKEVQQAFPGFNFAQARAVQKACVEFSILEHHARHSSEEEFLKKFDESISAIMEREPFYGDKTISKADLSKADSSDDDVKRYNDYMAAYKSAKGGKGPEDTMGPKIDVSSGEESPEPEKKGMLAKIGSWFGDKKNAVAGLKKFVKKAAEFVEEFIKSKEGKRAIGIAAVMVIISVIPGAAMLLPIAKGLLGLYGIFKGTTGMLKQGKELSGGKKGVDGVKEFFKNVSNVKEAAKAIANLASIGLGAWGASKAIGDVLTQIKTAAAEATYNSDGAPSPTQSVKPEAPAASKPEAPAPQEGPKVTTQNAELSAASLSDTAMASMGKASAALKNALIDADMNPAIASSRASMLMQSLRTAGSAGKAWEMVDQFTERFGINDGNVTNSLSNFITALYPN